MVDSKRHSVYVSNAAVYNPGSAINSIIETIRSSNENLTNFLKFSLIFTEPSELRISFDSLSKILVDLCLERLTIKIKIIPDGKVKYLHVEKNPNVDERNSLTFSHVSPKKLIDQQIKMKLTGENQMKTFDLGQIGPIQLKQLENIQIDKPIEFLHEIERLKSVRPTMDIVDREFDEIHPLNFQSSIELLVKLEQNFGKKVIVTLQQIKGVKVNPKNLGLFSLSNKYRWKSRFDNVERIIVCFLIVAATGYFRASLLEQHRTLSEHLSQTYRLDCSQFELNDSFKFDVAAFNDNDFDRLMVNICFFSDADQNGKHVCIARVKLGSSYLTSGFGVEHWKHLKQRRYATMWHKLIKVHEI